MNSFIFFGSDRFSAIVLAELIRRDSPPTLVVTDPPRPTGRHGEITQNAVEEIARNANLKVLYYKDNQAELIKFILDQKSHTIADKVIGLSASFPHLFPPVVITAFGGNLYNLHPSLLPQYRNVAPGPYAIAMGDKVTGISLFPIGIGIDNGELVAQQKEDILPSDSTTTLLNRLFTIGAQLFLSYLNEPDNPTLTNDIPVMSSAELIFTRKLKRESGYIEWDALKKLIENNPITPSYTANPLIKLRLTHHPDRNTNILTDLIRALDTYERVWTIAPTKKGDLSVNIVFAKSPTDSTYAVLIPGKPRPIPYHDFVKYYL